MFSFFYSVYNLLFSPVGTRFYYLSLIKEDDNTYSIHGLWPQYTKNSYPSYCKKVKFSEKALAPIIDDLNKYWYSDRGQNDYFWKHEYEKHGSCMYGSMNEFQYFSKTLELYHKAIKLGLPPKYENNKTKKCLIPVSLDFDFIHN
tara:strand:+ start:35 stop:469 length:435 start_codon:yes stop_codon:yes gene_type:complete